MLMALVNRQNTAWLVFKYRADLAELLQILRDGHIEPGGPLGENPSATIEHLATLAEGSLLSIFPAPHQPSR